MSNKIKDLICWLHWFAVVFSKIGFLCFYLFIYVFIYFCTALYKLQRISRTGNLNNILMCN